MIKYPELDSGFEPYQAAKGYTASINRPTKIIWHHTGGTDANPLADSSNFTFKQCNEYHKKFGMKSSLGYWCGYHYYIEKDGTIYQARADNEEGAHTIGQNNQSIGVCNALNGDVKFLTDAQLASSRKLALMLMRRHNIPASLNFPHRKYAKKTCYGKRFNDTWAKNTAKAALAEEVKRLGAEVEIINQLNK